MEKLAHPVLTPCAYCGVDIEISYAEAPEAVALRRMLGPEDWVQAGDDESTRRAAGPEDWLQVYVHHECASRAANGDVWSPDDGRKIAPEAGTLRSKPEPGLREVKRPGA